MVSIDDLVTNNHKKSALYEVWNGQKLMIGSLVFTLGDNVIAILEYSVWGKIMNRYLVWNFFEEVTFDIENWTWKSKFSQFLSNTPFQKR